MKKFRVKNLTVSVGSGQQLKKCGVNFSCPGGAGSVCAFTDACRFPSNLCDGITIHCFTGSVNCGPVHTLGCPGGSIDCLITRGGCGLNYSTLPPTEFSVLIDNVEDVTDKLELIDVLKDDLNVALKNISELETDLSKTARPQTLDEAKAVEKDLQGALKEVQTLMKKLK